MFGDKRKVIRDGNTEIQKRMEKSKYTVHRNEY